MNSNFEGIDFSEIDSNYVKDAAKYSGIAEEYIEDIEKLIGQQKKYNEYLEQHRQYSQKFNTIIDNEVTDIGKQNTRRVYEEIARSHSAKGGTHEILKNIENVEEARANYLERVKKYTELISNGGIGSANIDEIEKLQNSIIDFEKRVTGGVDISNLSTYTRKDLVSNIIDQYINSNNINEAYKNIDETYTSLSKKIRQNVLNKNAENKITDDIIEDSINNEVKKIRKTIEHSSQEGVEKLAKNTRYLKFGKAAGKYALGALALYGIVQILHDDKGMDNSTLYSQTPII